MTITRNRSFAARAAAVLMALIAVAVIFSFSPAEITASASAIETENYSVSVSANAKDNTTQVMLMAADTTANTGTGTNDTTGDDTYQTVINFFVKWIKRVGFLVAFVGAIPNKPSREGVVNASSVSFSTSVSVNPSSCNLFGTSTDFSHTYTPSAADSESLIFLAIGSNI